jgi:hypothetical protein
MNLARIYGLQRPGRNPPSSTHHTGNKPLNRVAIIPVSEHHLRFLRHAASLPTEDAADNLDPLFIASYQND